MKRQTMRSKWRSTRRITYIVLVVGLIGVMVVYAVANYPPAPPGINNSSLLDFQDSLAIQVWQTDGFHTLNPSQAVGEQGGVWATHQYDSYGIDSQHYPVYMDIPSAACLPTCTLHVKTKTAHDYTLGDFFAVWGHPIGPSNTLGYRSSSTMAWQMCISTYGASQVSNTQWGQLVLRPNFLIHLIYYNTTRTAAGCT